MKDWKGNKNSIYTTLGASNHTSEERECNDYYATDPIAIDKLLKRESLNKKLLEVSAGEGHLAEKLKMYGYDVITNDIVERNYKLDYRLDFLSGGGTLPLEDRDIITNPPYKYAKEFVLKALDIISEGRKVYMFLKVTFLEGKARYNDLFSKYPPKAIYVFSERVMCAKNGDFNKMREGGGSAVAYAWYVWEKGYIGKTTIEWI